MPAFQNLTQKYGAGVAVTPRSLSNNSGTRSLQRTLMLGTGAVVTQDYSLGVMPVPGRITEIRFHGTAAVTGTAITAEVKAYNTTGTTATSLQLTSRSIAFGSAPGARAGVTAALAALNPPLPEDVLLIVSITAIAITAGPGDLVVDVDFFPTEDTKTAGAYTTGAEILK